VGDCRMKEYIGCCVDAPYEELGLKDCDEFCEWLDKKEDLDLIEFVNSCNLDKELLKSIILYPSSYEYYKIGEVYFYVNSAIEYFYK
jgi:hypothetical protein